MKVSCNCLTYNRPGLLEEAIESFIRQDYDGEKELVILNDAPQQILKFDHPEVIVINLPRRFATVGEKRNACVALSTGDVIFPWDDDDISLPWRISMSLRYKCQKRYFKNRRAWMWSTDNLEPEPRWGVYHAMGCWDKTLFAQVGGYPVLQSGEDTVLEKKYDRIGEGEEIELRLDELFYIYRFGGTGSPHLSSFGIDRGWEEIGEMKIERVGSICLSPRWKEDYVGITKAAVNRLRMGEKVHRKRFRKKISTVGNKGPRLSVILPAHHSMSNVVRRTLLSLLYQTVSRHQFEVILVADGGDEGDLLYESLAPLRPHIATKFIISPRPYGDLPHRNHARNAGCGAAAGEILWVLDADFLLPPHAIAHVLHQFDWLSSHRRIPILSPCLSNINLSATNWLNRSESWLITRDESELRSFLRTLPLSNDVYSGFADFYRAGPPDSVSWPQMKEGFPALPCSLWRALGGFDNRFVDRGGDKEEFIRRLMALHAEEIVDVRLLRSVLLLHQPHSRRNTNKKDMQLRENNKVLFSLIMSEIAGGEDWWMRQKEEVISTIVSD